MHPAGGDDGGGNDMFWSAFTSTSEAERLRAWRCSGTPRRSFWWRYCRRGRRRTAPWRGIAASQTEWLGGRTSAPYPAGWQCLGLWCAGPRSWHSSSTSASATRKSRRWPLAVASGGGLRRWPPACETWPTVGVRPCLPGRPDDEYVCTCLRLQEQEFCAVRPAQLDPALGSSPASA